nr:xanthine dehydrogenase accessory protein XdhC [Propionibacterium sp.]
MHWSEAVTHLRRGGRPGVLVTILRVRGHAPRDAGAKMVVSADGVWGTIGGGNLEHVAVEQARAMLADGAVVPQQFVDRLNDREGGKQAQQCCGGEVTVVLEPLPALPTVAILGVGHVGLEVARLLARLEVCLVLVDSRPEMVAPDRLAGVVADAPSVIARHLMAPEAILDELPAGAEVLVMTHDHAEDFAILDAALRRPALGWIGLIGSSVKWGNFRRRLGEAGFAADDIARITCPIGLPGIAGKEPAVIAVSVAADFLRRRSG